MREIIGNTTATPNPRPDWNQTDDTKADYIKNKPEILTEEDVVELIAEHGGSGGGAQIQSDWNQTDATQMDYIKNKPKVGEVLEASIVGDVLVLKQNPGMYSGGSSVNIVQETGDDADAVMSQKAVTDALGEKLKKIAVTDAYKSLPVLYGRDGNKTADNAKEFAAARGNWANNFVMYSSTSDTYANTDNKGTIAVTTPKKPLHAANMQYVNDEDKKLLDRILELEDTLGSIFTTLTWEYDTREIEVPSGALSNVYFGAVTTLVEEYDPFTGAPIDTHFVPPTTIFFMGAAMEELECRSFSPNSYQTMPEGTHYITFNWDEVAQDSGSACVAAGFNSEITFQVLKVGV